MRTQEAQVCRPLGAPRQAQEQEQGLRHGELIAILLIGQMHGWAAWVHKASRPCQSA